MAFNKLLSALFLLQLFLCFATAQLANCTDGYGTYGTRFDSVVTWQVNCTSQTISMTHTSPYAGWVAVGWNSRQGMGNADVVIGWISDAQYIYDCTNYGTQGPRQQLTQSSTNREISTNGTYITLRFTKPLTAANANGTTLTPGNNYYLVAAAGPSNPNNNLLSNAPYHMANGIGLMQSVQQNFFAVPTPVTTTGGSSTTGSATTGTTTGAATSTTGSSTGGQHEGCSGGEFYFGEYSNSDNSWSIRWAIDCSAHEFSAMVTAKATGWVGFGIASEAQSMYPAGVIQATCTNETVNIRNGHTVTTSLPVLDTTATYFDGNCSQSGGFTTIGFKRSILTVDGNGAAFSGGDTNMIWAYHPTDVNFNAYHSNNRGPVVVNFFTGKTSVGVDLFLVHGTLMIIAWALLSPVGILIARFLKPIGHLWYQLHVSLQGLAALFMLIAFIIVEVALGSDASQHFKNAHNDIGLLVVILVFIQVIIGQLANKFYDPDRSSAPIFPDKLHWIVGGFVMIFAVVNIFLGIDVAGFTGTSNGSALFVTYGVWIGLAIVFWIILQLFGPGATHAEMGVPTKINRMPSVVITIFALISSVLFAIFTSFLWRK